MARFVSCPHKPDTAEINRLFHNLDHESDVASESEAESASDTESEESDEEALKKEMKKKAMLVLKVLFLIKLATSWFLLSAAVYAERRNGSGSNARRHDESDESDVVSWCNTGCHRPKLGIRV